MDENEKAFTVAAIEKKIEADKKEKEKIDRKTRRKGR